MLQTLAILCTEEEYAHRLMEYMNQWPEFAFKAVVFTNTDYYLEYEKHKHVDVLLFDTSISESFFSEVHPGAAYCLTDQKGEKEHFQKKCIFMYQSAKQIISNLYTFYKEDQTTCNVTGQTRQVCITGCFGVDMSSNWLSAVKTLIEKEEKRLLYIEWNPFLKLEEIKDSRFRLTEMIYTLNKEEELDTQSLLDCIGHGEHYDYIIGAEHFNDLFELSEEAIFKAMNFFRKECEYECILMDMPVLCPVFSELLKYCDLIYESAADEDVIREELKRQLLLSNGEELVGQIQFL